MVEDLSCRENFAGFTINYGLGGHFVVDKYEAKDPHGQNCVLRVFRDWKAQDPKTQLIGGGYEVKLSDSRWTQHFPEDHKTQGAKGVGVDEETGNRFEYFQNRLSITEDLSGVPGFPEIVAAGAYEGHLYFATKWIEGQDLRHKIKYSEMNSDEKLKIMHQLVLPIERMHSRNLLHNDVKPSNYILGNDGKLVLMDFDLGLYGERRIFDGKSVLCHEAKKSRVGTIEYLAPEITTVDLGIGFTEFSDVWSGLGVTPYLLMTKGLPFIGRDISELCGVIRWENPTRIERLLTPGFPQRGRVSDLVHWCLEKDWKKRPRAVQFRKELEGILTEVGIDWNRKSNIKVV
jgi:serine/threonine protein kinase